MALLKGSNLPPEQAAQEGISDAKFDSMPPEERRLIERGTIILKLRRYWRLICVGLAIFSSIVNIIGIITSGNGSIGGIFGAIVLSFIGWGIIYLINLYLFLYILIDKVLMAYFYVRDLTTKKDTTL